MTANEFVLKLPEYGFLELKEFIRKNTYKAFIYTISIFALLFLLYFIYGKVTETSVRKFVIPIAKTDLLKVSQQTDELEDAPPPPPTETVIDVATAAKAGTPLAVPDAEIKEELKEFASVDELSKSLSKEKGQIVDFNQVQPDFDKKVEINTKIEKEPDPEEFIAVEQEPQVDLGELQRKIVYPEMARRAGIEGQVIVRVLVGKDGRPMKTLIQHSDSQMLDQAAKDAVMKSVFTPGIMNGNAIVCWVSIPIKFKLR